MRTVILGERPVELERWIAHRRAIGAHGVDEVVITDPADRSLVWMRLTDGEYRQIDHSTLLDIDVADIVAAIDWPPVADGA